MECLDLIADFQVSTHELSGFDEGSYRVWSKAGMEAGTQVNAIDQHFTAVNSLSKFQRETLTCTPQA
jgi:hypothetical protein